MSTAALLWLWSAGTGVRKSKVLTVFVNGGDCSTSLNVTFRPTSVERCMADIYISIRHNMYEDSLVQLVGEGYVETVTVDDVTCSDHLPLPLLPAATDGGTPLAESVEEEDEDMPG